jgi:O-antigen/teichoic acid export membrane protein
MSGIQENNKRILKNTALLYLRMFISMTVSLFTSRVVLQTLGVENYGIYNVVGGIVPMFAFISGTMSSATSRFITFELGKGEVDKLNDTFNASFWCHVIIAIIIFIFSETIGLWFLHTKMIIPEGREFAADILLQFSIISTVVSIIIVPFNATIIAHEKMNVYAYVEMVNVFLRLAILFLLVKIDMDKLILYGFLLFVISLGTSFFYYIYCFRNYEACRIKKTFRSDIVKSMLSFSGWDLFGNMSVTARTQGVSMLLNIFFGPILNAASGIATSVQAAVMSFAGNVNTAVRPQIIKYYAQGEYHKMESLINNACSLNFLILSLIIIPLSLEIDYILAIWLGNVPNMTNVFTILTLFFNLFANMSFLVNTGNVAAGKIFRPSFINGSLYLLVVPITYILFKLGGYVWLPYMINLVAVFFGMLFNVYTLHLNVPEYSVKTFLKKVLIKCIMLIFIGGGIGYLVHNILEPSIYRVIVTFILTTIFMGIFGWYILLPNGIRIFVINKVNLFLCKRI